MKLSSLLPWKKAAPERPTSRIVFEKVSEAWAMPFFGGTEDEFKAALSYPARDAAICAALPSLWNPDADPTLEIPEPDEAWKEAMWLMAAAAGPDSWIVFDALRQEPLRAMTTKQVRKRFRPVVGYAHRFVIPEGGRMAVYIDTEGEMTDLRGNAIADVPDFLRGRARHVGEKHYQVVTDPMAIQMASLKRERELRVILGEEGAIDTVDMCTAHAIAVTHSGYMKKAAIESRAVAAESRTAKTIFGSPEDLYEGVNLSALKDRASLPLGTRSPGREDFCHKTVSLGRRNG